LYNSFTFFFRSTFLFVSMVISLVTQQWILVWLLILSCLVPSASATPLVQRPFPNIPFSTFSDAIQSIFGSSIYFATVLAVSCTLFENPDLLNLHFRQQQRICGDENKVQITGWITALSNALVDKLGNKRTETLFCENELAHVPDKKTKVTLLARKLDKLASCLKLSTFDEKGNYKGKLLPVSHSKIEPAYVICPPSFSCQTQDCSPRSLRQSTKACDIPLVTLIKGQTVNRDVPVLTGKCPSCKTLYAADHERFEDTSTIQNTLKRVYVNSAKYLKIGQLIWADRGFATAVINAMYNFHASASAFSEYWNNTHGTKEFSITHAHVWQAFVQQSVRTIAEESGIDAEFDDGLNIKEVTTQAFSLLGEDGIIRASEKHACDECTQKRKDTSDVVFNNTAAVVGVDATDDDIPPLEAAPEQMEIDAPAVPSDDEMDTDDIPNIRMVVLDGIVMGPQVNNFIFFLLSLFVHNDFFSTVHMTIVLKISLMLVVDHYVTYII
jgi:hypothetical protein